MFLTLYPVLYRPVHKTSPWVLYSGLGIVFQERYWCTWKAPKTCYEISSVYKEFKLRTNLGLYSLSRRRQRCDLIETYKVLRNIWRHRLQDLLHQSLEDITTNCTKTDHWNNAECASSASELLEFVATGCSITAWRSSRTDWTNSWTATSWAVKAYSAHEI